MEKGFRLCDGPFVKGLDNALKSFNVHREQYYGGIFVGNHIHRTLKVYTCSITRIYNHTYLTQPSNLETLCSSVERVAETLLPSLSEDATTICDTFKLVFTLFAKCHMVYDQKFVSDKQAKELGK